MNCRNCGNSVSPQAPICPECGVNPKHGENYCQQCGNTTFSTDKICINCGSQLVGQGKDWLITLLLEIFMGTMGVHRFYTGNIGMGILQLLTAGGCGIWWVIDLILILNESYRDGDGNPLDKSKY